MSSEAVADAAGSEPGSGKAGKLKWIIIAAAVLAAGGGGAFIFLGKSKSDAAPTKDAPAKTTHAAPVYYKFDPAFVVNFGGEGNSRYLQITLEVMSRKAEVIEAVKANEPAIRNDLVMLFSSQQYDVLMSPQGKDTLRQTTLESIRKAVAKEGTNPEEVEGVYFTSFVIQ
jgi:flagellar FliL protein